MATGETTGLILAGGAGRRVGGRDKGLLEWQGRSLVEHVAGRLRPQVTQLLISCNRNCTTYARLADAIVGDRRPGFQGPLAGIEAAAEQLQTEFLVVVPCDMPQLPPDLASRLLAPMHATSGQAPDICYAGDGSRDQYLCAALRSSVLASLTAFLDHGGRAVRQWYRLHRLAVVDFSDAPGCFINCNEAAAPAAGP